MNQECMIKISYCISSFYSCRIERIPISVIHSGKLTKCYKCHTNVCSSSVLSSLALIGPRGKSKNIQKYWLFVPLHSIFHIANIFRLERWRKLVFALTFHSAKQQIFAFYRKLFRSASFWSSVPSIFKVSFVIASCVFHLWWQGF